jgi:transposase-like protein
MSEKKRLKKDYDPEFRQQAAKLVIVEKMGVSAAAKDLGIPVNSLHTWVRKFREGIWRLDAAVAHADDAAAKKGQATPKLPSSSQKQHDRFQQLEASHRDLEIKLRRMTQERDVLKNFREFAALHL